MMQNPLYRVCARDPWQIHRREGAKLKWTRTFDQWLPFPLLAINLPDACATHEWIATFHPRSWQMMYSVQGERWFQISSLGPTPFPLMVTVEGFWRQSPDWAQTDVYHRWCLQQRALDWRTFRGGWV